MPQGFGRNSYVGWDQETTWGTGVAAAKFAELVSENVETIRQRDARPVVRDLDEREGNLYDTLFGVKGPFTIEANYGGMLRLLEHLFGDSSGSSVATEPGVRTTHTFITKDTLMTGKGLSLHIGRDVDAGSTPTLRAVGYKLNSAKFSMAPDRNAIGFDYNGAQFTHARNQVTFEVLRGSFGLDRDPALMAIGAAVHFLDVGGIPAADARGLETLLKGIKQKARSDDELLAEASRVLDFFYSAYTDKASIGGAGRLPASQTRAARPSSALEPAAEPG